MRKLFWILLVVLPLTITAAPIDVPVSELFWSHDGVDTAGYEVQCNGVVVLSTNSEARAANITGLSDGPQSCQLVAVSPEGRLSPPSNTIDFFIVAGQPMVTRLVPVAPSNFGVR